MSETQPPRIYEKVRDKDHAVLRCLLNGRNDTRRIREATNLTNREVEYCFEKLADLGLIETHTPEGMVEEIIDGQRKVFKAPREAALTDTGVRYFEWADREGRLDKYRALSKEELVRTVLELEERVETLETGFATFRRQVHTKLQQQ